MLLEELLEGLEYQCIKGNTQIEAEHLVYHTGKIEEGSIFVCLKGANFDSHQ
ncbi:MAG: UDP-N-acetylmuramoyl-L-alanyl-D-glutamate--2,6-diaminopimelate ligase, partial [Clostridia bacterium]|nr:UDP-N-acetylmuramoyl-L-alanyl-D-glutamate--2,6-diaminopimelate ligase [Clostridia bacterium]